MDDAKVPNDFRNWESINIFLFSNGQQYSPPRKYYLKSDDLRCWDTMKNYLARSQFGPTHTTIELYTLDGKKVEGPLELKNSAAYVAVVPPDSFISAGYEKYLIKASRSWEKRQERLSKDDQLNEDFKGIFEGTTGNEELEENIKQTVSKKDSTKLSNQNQQLNNINKLVIPKLTAIRDKSYENNKLITDNIENQTTRNKNSPLKGKSIDQASLRKKNMIFTKNFKNRNSKQYLISDNVPKVVTKTIKSKFEYKDNLNKQKNRKLKNMKESEYGFDEIENQGTKNLDDAVENICKDELKALFVKNEPHTSIVGSPNMPHELSKKNLLDSNIKRNSLETDKPNYHIDRNMETKDQKLTIKLRIKIEDFSNNFLKNDLLLERKTSIITLIKEEKASQVNIDVILSKDIFNFNKLHFLNEIADKNKCAQYFINGVKRSVVECSCDNFTENNISNEVCFCKKASNDVLRVYTIDESKTDSCECDQAGFENVEKEILIMPNTYKVTLNSDNKKEKAQSVANRKNLIANKDPPGYHNLIYQKNDEGVTENGLFPKMLMNRYAQTEWCNLLLLAKCEENGQYSFHLPSLSLLKKYNMNQM